MSQTKKKIFAFFILGSYDLDRYIFNLFLVDINYAAQLHQSGCWSIALLCIDWLKI